MKAFVFDPLWPNLVNSHHKKQLEEAGVEVFLTTEIASLRECKPLYADNESRILAINPDYVGWKVLEKDYRDIPNLQAIALASTAFGYVESGYAKQQGIPVINIRNFSTDAVAEWSVMMMLNIARRVPMLIKAGFPLNFGSDFETYQGINLVGKKVGIVGLGNIGAAIAARCAGLGMEVVYWSKSAKDVPHRRVGLAELFADADVIFPTMAINNETKVLITDELIGSMKHKTLWVSNTIPEHMYFNHQLLLSKVKDGSLFGYAFEEHHPDMFKAYEGNVWAAPAYAWCTQESLRKAMDLFVDAICGAASNQFPTRVV